MDRVASGFLDKSIPPVRGGPNLSLGQYEYLAGVARPPTNLVGEIVQLLVPRLVDRPVVLTNYEDVHVTLVAPPPPGQRSRTAMKRPAAPATAVRSECDRAVLATWSQGEDAWGRNVLPIEPIVARGGTIDLYPAHLSQRIDAGRTR